MPPWLVALLKQSNSAGLLDTLSKLVGTQPGFVQIPDRVQTDRVKGKVTQQTGQLMVDAQGNPQIGLTPYLIKNFLSQQQAGYQQGGWTPLAALLGDATITHEFGHLAARSGTLADLLEKVNPQAETSETFADRFQNVVQFLRSGRTDIGVLTDPQTRGILGVLLSQPIYKDHPLNKVRPIQSK